MGNKKNKTTPTGTTISVPTTTTTIAAPPVSTPVASNQNNKWKHGANAMGPMSAAQEQAQQFANLAKLYRQTFQTPLQLTQKKFNKAQDQAVSDSQNHMPGPGGFIARTFNIGGTNESDKTNQLTDQLSQMRNRRNNALPVLQKLINFAGAQGFAPEDTQQALQTYLQQEQALSQFMPRHYRAPNKQDLLGAVNNYAPQYQAEREAQQQYEQLIPFMAMIRDSMLQTADADYEYMSEKAMQLRDPEKQAQALNNADALYRLKMLQADAIASNPMSNDPRSIASMLGAFNSGQTKNINNLYGGASNLPDNTGTTSPSQAIDDTFIQQVLAGQ